MSTAIEFNHVSKQYRLGLVSTRTLSHDLDRWWKMNILGKEDPYLKIGETNDRATKGESDYVWALKDIDFKVEQGDVVGIIGKNGAGKSTLLKLLSKVTGPTTGSIKARGRIGALLEVGTGFHSEMTGRENIFLNGAILGMSKQEVARKLDEIVDFSGCERYLDTPVKRYSSGMMVRLGFAVAAHLDPEILVVDEVLAVGDAEFQKKAIGKMQDVSRGEGRTVLFVSHNMNSIALLCKQCLLLENGRILEIGETSKIISSYLNTNFITNSKILDTVSINGMFYIKAFIIKQSGIQTEKIHQGEPFSIGFTVENTTTYEAEFICNIEIKTESSISVTCIGNEMQNSKIFIPPSTEKQIEFRVPENLFKRGTYYLSPYFQFRYRTNDGFSDKYLEYAKKIEITDASPLYFSNSNHNWQSFPTLPQHGHIGLKTDISVQ